MMLLVVMMMMMMMMMMTIVISVISVINSKIRPHMQRAYLTRFPQFILITSFKSLMIRALALMKMSFYF